MIAALFSIALSLTLLAAAVYLWSQSTLARGRAEAFQKVADDFRGLSNIHWWHTFGKKAEQERERKKLFLSLALCTPEVREALREALAEADEKWSREA